ncbi:hypothetical protein BD289DRAFT_176192 [Coniella lustricola]|uniref:Uncharacterized protein n=1 Tax=Coniella lustricola TaxID=2025994 RepID=A0A2T2ZTN2_9PEZI|nr:hypothetical protein BD289DRAFT_176192 [Coniella lustricola]
MAAGWCRSHETTCGRRLRLQVERLAWAGLGWLLPPSPVALTVLILLYRFGDSLFPLVSPSHTQANHLLPTFAFALPVLPALLLPTSLVPSTS